MRRLIKSLRHDWRGSHSATFCIAKKRRAFSSNSRSLLSTLVPDAGAVHHINLRHERAPAISASHLTPDIKSQQASGRPNVLGAEAASFSPPSGIFANIYSVVTCLPGTCSVHPGAACFPSPSTFNRQVAPPFQAASVDGLFQSARDRSERGLTPSKKHP
jgi:hypothetical protein